MALAILGNAPMQAVDISSNSNYRNDIADSNQALSTGLSVFFAGLAREPFRGETGSDALHNQQRVFVKKPFRRHCGGMGFLAPLDTHEGYRVSFRFSCLIAMGGEL